MIRRTAPHPASYASYRYAARGTTLAETIIAVAILSLLMLTIASGLRTLSLSEKRVRAVGEVEAQAGVALYQITQSLRNASAITSPATSTTATSMTLASQVTAENPTLFSLSSGAVTMAIGNGTAVPLTGQNVSVTSLSFQNVSSTTARAVRVSLTVAYQNLTGNTSASYSNTYVTTVTLR